MRIQPKTKRTVELVSNIYGYYIIKIIYEDRTTGVHLEKLGSSSQSPMHAEQVALGALELELEERENTLRKEK